MGLTRVRFSCILVQGRDHGAEQDRGMRDAGCKMRDAGCKMRDALTRPLPEGEGFDSCLSTHSAVPRLRSRVRVTGSLAAYAFGLQTLLGSGPGLSSLDP